MRLIVPSFHWLYPRVLPLLLSLGTLGCAEPARADFSGYYDLTPPAPGLYNVQATPYNATIGNWTLYHPGNLIYPGTALAAYVDTRNAPGTLTLQDRIDFDLRNSAFYEFSFIIEAPLSGFVSFDYNAQVSHDGNTPFSRAGYYDGNGQFFALSGTGTVTLSINAGQFFRFDVLTGRNGATDGTYASASLRISNFSAPVPEPSSTFLLSLGLMVAGWFGWCRWQNRLAS